MKRDGPSLWIREPGKAGRRVPARLVSRVVIIGNVRLDTDSLMLFSDHGVPITFLSSSGETRASLLTASSPDMRGRQRILAEDDFFCRRAERWMETERRANRLNVLRSLAPALAREFECLGFRNSDYDTALLTLCPVAGRAAVWSMVSGLVHELVLQKIVDSGLDPHCGILHRRESFGLCKDFLHVLDAEIDRQTVQFFHVKRPAENARKNKRAVRPSAGVERHIIHRFENHRPRISTMVDALLDGYFRLLREIP